MITAIKQLWNEYCKEIEPEIKEIKEAWANGIDEIHIIWADAKTEQHQKNIDKLAIEAQLKIDELKQNPYFK
jgi:thiol-disulfide isomerase/thioredoxin